MNKQEILNHVVNFQRKQWSRCEGDQGARCGWGCLYRDGNKACAAGCLIPPKDYDPNMEGSALSLNGSRVRAYFIIHFGMDNLPLIEALQHIHDHSSLEKWEEEWASLAKREMLSLPDLQQHYQQHYCSCPPMFDDENDDGGFRKGMG